MKITLSAIALAAALGITGTADYESEQQQVELCEEMVELWYISNGENGWPEQACHTTNNQE